MRARGIKPSFFTDEALVELPFEARLLFMGLWCVADREGRLQDRPKQLRIQLFPCDSVDVDGLLDRLQGENLILRYQVAGSPLHPGGQFQEAPDGRTKTRSRASSPARGLRSPEEQRARPRSRPEYDQGCAELRTLVTADYALTPDSGADC